MVVFRLVEFSKFIGCFCLREKVLFRVGHSHYSGKIV